MQQVFQESVYRGLSDAMQACIDTGNEKEAEQVLDMAFDAYHQDQLQSHQLIDIISDFDQAYP